MSFPLFQQLPLELRRQIWDYAVPELDTIGQTFFYYKLGCWEPSLRKQLEDDTERPDFTGENRNDGDDGNDIIQVFRHELLDPVQVQMDLQFTNHEARDVVRKRLAKYPGTKAFHQQQRSNNKDNSQSFISFAATFNPQRDCLYVAQDMLPIFLTEPVDRWFAPDILDRFFDMLASPVRFLAVPAAALVNRDVREHLGAVLEDFFWKLEEIWIVVGHLPQHQHRLACLDDIVHQCWGIDETWDEATCQAIFDVKDDNNSMKSQQVSINELKNMIKSDIDETLTGTSLRNLLIRAVAAVQK